MATDIIARGMITEYIAGTNINFTENRDGTVEISASGSISSEDSVARDAIGNHKSDTSNPHNVTPAQIGLGNVDNTSDLDKPISTAVQKAIDSKADKTVATTSADGLMSAEDKSKLDAFEITKTGGKLHDKDIATTDLIPTSLPANGGNADTAHQVIGSSSKIKLYEDNEGGNLRLVSPDGVHYMEMDLYNNEQFRMYFDGGDGIIYPLTYNFTNKKLNINGDASTVNGHTVEADVPADAKFTDTVPDLTLYALKSKYGDTTIDVGRKNGTTVGSYSTAEGIKTTASGAASHTEGDKTTASGLSSHAEGNETTASGDHSHAEGYCTTASGTHSHAEGLYATASNTASHAEGRETTASGVASHAGGTGTKALHDNEVSYGKYNKSNNDTLFSIGDGTTDANRHNAFEITTTGGKLHDKDIATTDLIPTSLPANGGSADYATNAGNAEKLGGKDASAYSTSIIKSVTFSAATTNGYIWTGIAFPKYVIGVDLGHFDVIAQFYKGNNIDAARAEWAMIFLNRDDVTTPLNGSFNGVIYYID